MVKMRLSVLLGGLLLAPGPVFAQGVDGKAVDAIMRAWM